MVTIEAAEVEMLRFFNLWHGMGQTSNTFPTLQIDSKLPCFSGFTAPHFVTEIFGQDLKSQNPIQGNPDDITITSPRLFSQTRQCSCRATDNIRAPFTVRVYST